MKRKRKGGRAARRKARLWEKIEDRIDVELAKQAWDEQGNRPLIAWEQVVRELDLEQPDPALPKWFDSK